MDLKLTTIIAVYAAVLGTLNLLWSIRNSLIDRASVRVRVRGVIASDPIFQGSDTGYSIDIVNVGRRPVVLVDAGFTLTGHEKLIWHECMTSFPIELTEGQRHSVHIGADELEKYRDRAICAFVSDSTGKTHRSSKRELRGYLRTRR